MQKITEPTKQKDITTEWQIVDVKNKVLGRVSVEIAHLLMGKRKAYFAKNLDCGDNVVIINAKDVRTTGKKEDQKTYTRYSGYPGGLRRETLKELRVRKPEEIIRHAVAGMLPKNKLRDKMLKHLFIFPGKDHTYGNKFSKES